VVGDDQRMSRRERQQAQVLRALERGHVARSLVLAREHLCEFPDDTVVRDAAERAARLMRWSDDDPN
jgi:hypothetical protein